MTLFDFIDKHEFLTGLALFWIPLCIATCFPIVKTVKCECKRQGDVD